MSPVMSKAPDLRVVEVYVSYQGEGPNTGKPTVFVRFAGCNFTCKGWPCDTQHAIDPKLYRTLQRHVDPGTLADEVLALGVQNVCLTGGEVWLQSGSALYAFIGQLKQSSNHEINVECFTNGSLTWDADCLPLIDNFIVDWKLPGSGETDQYVTNTKFRHNFDRLGDADAIKFTIKDRKDYDEAKRRYASIIVPTMAVFSRTTVYAGVVWPDPFTGRGTATEVLCQWMIEDKLPWSLNVQVHKFIWHPDKIGV